MAIAERTWRPDWATHPGEHLLEYLEAREMSQADLARLSGLTPKLISTILSKRNPVTPDTALKLERVLGLRADVWLTLQSRFDLNAAQTGQAIASSEFLSRFPLKELVERSVLPTTNDVSEIANALLAFLGIGTPEALTARVAALNVRHRRSNGTQSRDEHVLCWLLLGEMRARQMNVGPFDEQTFRKVLIEIRRLTVRPASEFQRTMIEKCRGAGVAVVFEPPISKTSVFGSARWFDNERAVIQMSLRRKFNDHFWWTFFHEAGHIILHRGKNFTDDDAIDGDELEREANEFATDILVGRDRWNKFLGSRPTSRIAVLRFAQDVGIHPGIVVGMLQHHGVIAFRNLNNLKERFEWA